MDIKAVDKVCEHHNNKPEQLIGILQDVQKEYNYLPREVIERVAEKLDIPESRVYAVATFFKAFSLKPRGKHHVCVCMGTACHVRGAGRVLEEFERELGIKQGENTKDMQFTLETVNCVGACALGPVAVVDGKYHGKIPLDKVKNILKCCKCGTGEER